MVELKSYRGGGSGRAGEREEGGEEMIRGEREGGGGDGEEMIRGEREREGGGDWGDVKMRKSTPEGKSPTVNVADTL